jgi:hypothetical protein
MGFGPLGNNNRRIFYRRIFLYLKMIFWLVLRLEISYYRVIIYISKDFGFF